MARALLGIFKNANGVFYARKKVPKRLKGPVARVIGNGKVSQTWLKKSLGTKDLKEAKVRAKPVHVAFDRTLAEAEKLLAQRPLVTSLSQVELRRLSEYHYSVRLANDDAGRRHAARILSKHFGLPRDPNAGVTEQEHERRTKVIAETLTDARKAFARGDLSFVEAEVEELLQIFGINLDRECNSYRVLLDLVLQAEVRAFDVMLRRQAGEVIATPNMVEMSSHPVGVGDTVSAAFLGWERERERSANTIIEYTRALALFLELHGDMKIVAIKRSHARSFREALQNVPRHRPANLRLMKLPELAAWGADHAEAVKISAATINKLIGGVQAIVVWAHDKGGMVGDDSPWADPFARMRLQEQEPSRESFESHELSLIFSSEVFTQGARPAPGKGEAAFWLPLLALVTGARRGELATLGVSDVEPFARGYALRIAPNRKRATRLKTKGSRRAVPLHSQIVRLGFIFYVNSVREKHGDDAWLFGAFAEHTDSALKAWTKWFHRYIASLGISDPAKVFHSFRHGFKDALRAGGTREDVIDALAGHSPGSVSRGYGAKDMARRFGEGALVSAIEGGVFGGVDFELIAPPTKHE